MKKRSLLFVFTMMVVLLSPLLVLGADSTSSLDGETLTLISKSVFEVVTPKPKHDSLTYEKELPLDLLPYAERTDEYYSIGTAFAIGPNTFVSASHVMNLEVLPSQFEEVYLRDAEGNVYSIDRITKFSDRRDFIIFSLKGKKAERYLEVNTSPRTNERVYAVGNALGQGIVIRDGLYTSNTPEEIDGTWQWIRFSAAASPGNSGGPLLDAQGKVIGIVLGKSENENLNYALPIREALDAKKNTAVTFRKTKYVLENMDFSKMGTFEKEIPLPKSYRELKKELTKSFSAFALGLLDDFLAENREHIFPQGDESAILLHSLYTAVFPHLIMMGKDGNWDAYYPSDTETAELGDNGYMIHGGIADSLLLYMRKPDSVSLKDFYGDSRLYMDLILKGLYFYRQVGSEKVKVTSLGEADQDYTYTDSYGRRWMVRTWPIEYSDEKIIIFSLPVPGGCIAMVKEGQSGLVDVGYLADMKVLTDFVYVSYYGTYEEWKEFLAMKDMLPEIFSTMDISIEKDSLRFSSRRLSFTHTPEMMSLTERSDLNLLFSYFKEGKKVVWDVGGVVVGEDKNNKTFFGIYRKNKPGDGLRDSYQNEWERIVAQKFPFNNSAYFKDGKTVIRTVHGGEEAAATGKSPFLYTITFQVEGTVPQDEMETKLGLIDGSVKVLEKGKGKANTVAATGPRM
ncbi:MAG: serine protease [Nitrospirota bacterium]